MFSRKEREYLEFLAARGAPPLPGAASEPPAYPVSPGYLRKLQWGIRQKVAAVEAERRLFESAAAVDPRIRPLAPGTPAVDPSLPVHADALVVLGRRLGRSRKGPRTRQGRTEGERRS